MRAIIPLAGPDFYDDRYGVKPLTLFEGKPLIQTAIESRCWYQSGELRAQDIVFVLRETPHSESVIHFLKSTFAGCKWMMLSALTRGALYSSMAGLALVDDHQSPIVVDLVDILYSSKFNVKQLFADDPILGGVLPFFPSVNPKYSYLQCEDGYVVQTAEKKVISDRASAGTYFFRNMPVLLEAYCHSLENSEELAVNGNLFLCPVFNGVVAHGRRVLPLEVENVREISLLFH